MTKRYDEPIEVTCDSVVPGAPLAFVWRGRRYDVDQHLKAWREAGEWWLAAGGNDTGRPDHAHDASTDANGDASHRAGYASARNAGPMPRVTRTPRRRPRERDYHRVLARPTGALASGDVDADGFLVSEGAVYDVYLDRLAGGWRLARVWD